MKVGPLLLVAAISACGSEPASSPAAPPPPQPPPPAPTVVEAQGHALDHEWYPTPLAPVRASIGLNAERQPFLTIDVQNQSERPIDQFTFRATVKDNRNQVSWASIEVEGEPIQPGETVTRGPFLLMDNPQARTLFQIAITSTPGWTGERFLRDD